MPEREDFPPTTLSEIDMSKSVRDRPPMSVVTFEMVDTYRTLYDDITDNGTVVQFVDRHALGELAVTICEMNELRNQLRTGGESIKAQGDRHMITKKNPAREALQRLYPVMMKLFSEFNMTPKARGNSFVGKGETSETKDDGFEDI